MAMCCIDIPWAVGCCVELCFARVGCWVLSVWREKFAFIILWSNEFGVLVTLEGSVLMSELVCRGPCFYTLNSVLKNSVQLCLTLGNGVSLS